MWVLVPLILATRLDGAALSAAAFAVLGAGLVGCVGGWRAQRAGSARVAAAQLATSGAYCLAAAVMLDAPAWLFCAWLVPWGSTASGDSPQFGALTAASAPRHAVGSVLTLANSIGFATSIVSIELHVWLVAQCGVPMAQVLPWLAIGPALGLWMLRGLWQRASA